MLEVKEVSKKFGERTILNNVSMSFEDTGFYTIMGESGSGKTTLLNLIASLDKDFGGEIKYDGTSILERKNYLGGDIAYFYQDHLLINGLSVYHNLALFGAKEEDILAGLTLFHMEGLKSKKVKKLSQGERKRVAFLRVLLHPAKVYLFDEPTVFLDEENKRIVLKALEVVSQKALVIVASHDKDVMKKSSVVYELCEGNITLKKDDLVKRNEKVSVSGKKHLSFSNKVLLALERFTKDKKKMVIGVTLFTLSFLLLYFSLLTACMDPVKMEAHLLSQEKDGVIFFDRSEENIDDIAEDTGKEVQIGKVYYDEVGQPLSYSFSLDDLYVYYQLYNGTLYFYEIGETTLENKDVIGSLDIGENEVLISQYFADLLIYYKGYKDYEDILSRGIISVSSKELRITGIIKQSLEPYTRFKTLENNSFGGKLGELYTSFEEGILPFATALYVSKETNILLDSSVAKMYIEENNYSKLLDIFKNYKDVYKTQFSLQIGSKKELLAQLAHIFRYVTGVILFLNILCTLSYLFYSKVKNRNENLLFQIEGIKLREVKCVYFGELFLLFGVSFLLTLFLATILMPYGNQVVMEQIYFDLQPFFFEGWSLFLFSLFVGLLLCLSLFPRYREKGFLKKKK